MPKGVYIHKPHSLETIEKIRASNLISKRTPEHRKKISEIIKNLYKIGKLKHTQGYPKSLLGRVVSEEEKKKTSERMKKYNPMFSSQAKEKIRQNRIGAKNPMWKGGITFYNQLIRGDYKYREWRITVLKRDNFTCQKCGYFYKKGIKNKKLQADHKKSFSKYPELRFDISNGETLCIECHKDKTKKNKDWQH